MNPILTAELATLRHNDRYRPDHRTSRPGRKSTLWRPDGKPTSSI